MLTREELNELQCSVKQVAVDDALVDYMLTLIERTRTHEGLSLGVSPRGSQALYRAVQANALVEGRGYALPDDVKVLAPKVLGHRVMPAAKSSLALRRDSNGAAKGERIIEEILEQIEVPL